MKKNKRTPFNIDELKYNFAELIEKYGEDGSLRIFTRERPIEAELDGSTIDEIQLIGDNNITFVYNANINDYDTIGAFDFRSLRAFYEEIKEELEDEAIDTISESKDFIGDEIDKIMRDVITDNNDRNSFIDSVLYAVISDMEDTADPKDWNSNDIKISLARVLLNGTYE